MMKFTNLVLVPLTLAATIAAAGCDSADSGDGDDGGGGTGNTGSGGTGNTGSGMDTLLQPDSSGWMDRMSIEWNDMDINGAWYPYGDQYGASKCTLVGEHMPAECSNITFPVVADEEFPQTVPFRMCTTGEVAQVLACDDDLLTRCPNCSGCPASDFSTMWGAGIGFDLNSEGGSSTAPKHPWNPEDHLVVGFSFQLVNKDGVDLPPPLHGIRVEIPMELNATDVAPIPGMMPGDTTDNHPDGAPYWGASSEWKASPLAAGKNCVTWAMISAPGNKRYMFDKARMLGVQFHVPTDATMRKPYDFCIQNFTMLRAIPTDCANTVAM